MDYLPMFLIGVILIVSGILVGRYPKLLMRYNSFPKEKEVVDWAGAGRLARRCMVGGGICQLLGTVVFIKLGLAETVIVFDVIVVMVVVIITIVKSRKYHL